MVENKLGDITECKQWFLSPLSLLYTWVLPIFLWLTPKIDERGGLFLGLTLIWCFIGGLIAGSAFIIRYLAGLRLTIRLSLKRRRILNPTTIIGVGLLISVATACIPLVFGDALLESAIWKWDWPIFGEVKIVSSAFFDLGVYVLVVGVVLLALVSLAADPEKSSSKDQPT